MKRKTILSEFTIEGKSWYEAKDTWIKCSPGNSGIFLKYKDIKIPISEARLNKFEEGYTTSILIGGEKIFMTEHLFSAIYGLEISDLLIEFGTDQVPFSSDAALFLEAFLQAKFKVLGNISDEITINKHIFITDGDGTCDIYPSDELEICSSVSFNFPVGQQSYSYTQDEDRYIKEICYARSLLIFPIDKEDPWKYYKKQFPIFPKTFPTNPEECPFISYNENGFLNGQRFENETARHKILDFLGDMLVLGKPIKGRFVLSRSGHSLNTKIVDEIKKNFS